MNNTKIWGKLKCQDVIQNKKEIQWNFDDTQTK